MRTAFIEALTDLAGMDQRVTLLVGDLGFGVVEGFARKYPDQFLNMGVAEQNMTGVAAGLALSGRVVFTYSIANFPTIRCLEQIRNDVCYHRANVKIVAVGGGYAYGPLGMTHHATEDLALMRVLPEMAVVAPGDPVETAAAVWALAAHDGPAYLRLGRAGEAVIHKAPVSFELGKAIQVRDGKDLCLIATGGLLQTALRVADTLAERGLACRVLSMHTVKPLDEHAVLTAARDIGAIATLEEHSIVGGLGSAVAELLAETPGVRATFKRIGLPSRFCSEVGDQDYLRARMGLSDQEILNTLKPLLAC